MKRRWLLFTLKCLTSLHGTFIIKKSDMSTRKQLEREDSCNQNTDRKLEGTCPYKFALRT